MEQWLAKINKLEAWQVACIIAVVGLTVFFTGLHNPFMGDDDRQIVSNIPVHSIANIRLFFEGSTFYNSQGLTPLSGSYYRPLMTTVFSLLYTLFGPHPVYFHPFQLILYIGGAILLYLFLQKSFGSILSLALSLVFLVHPVNSQAVFAIPSMQEGLFFFFGMLAIWSLVRFRSVRSLLFVALCLFLSLLSKEIGVLFVVMSALYLFWFDRKRLLAYLSVMVLPIIFYLLLKIHAVGLFAGPNQNIAPIASLSLGGRLLTAPAIVLFYITKFIFPWKLASAYYWVYPTFSVRHVLLPFVIDLAVVLLMAYLAFVIRKRTSKAIFYTYLLFSAWAALGLLVHVQFLPLDETVSETWLYFPMAGMLGMIGVVLVTFQDRIRPNWFYIGAAVVIGVFGLRTAVRGLDWKDSYTLATHDIIASKEDYVADNVLAVYYFNSSNFNQAKTYATQSIAIHPFATNYNSLGNALFSLGDYPGAYAAYTNGLKYASLSTLYKNLGKLTLVYGDPNTNKQFLISTISHYFPQDPTLWMDLAILEAKYNDNADAKFAISNAARYGHVPQIVYDNIMANKSFTISIAGKSIEIQ